MKNSVESKRIISVLLIALLLLFSINVYAANDSFGTTIKAKDSQVKREGTVTITIGLKNIAIESGEKGIGAYTANIKFDSSVFEYVSTNATSNWEAPFYQNGLIAGNTKNGEVVNAAQDIGIITLKVKKDAKLGETTISLSDFSGSTAVSDVSASDEFIKINIVDKNADNNNTNNNDNNNQNNENNNNNSNNNSNNSDKKNNNSNNNTNTNNNSNKKPSTYNTSKVENDTSKKQYVLPQTGTTNIIIMFVMGICSLSAAIFFIKMRLLNKK